jgi:MFS transporter, PPP family, 3-phenylpropionic acid transporter
MAHAQAQAQEPLARPLPRFLVLYALLYASFGVASPFLPAFIETRGISVEQIGFIFAAGTAIRLLSAPIAGRIADRYAIRREVLAACAIAAAGAALLYLPVVGIAGILIISLLQAIALAPLTPLADALALLAASRPRDLPRGGFEYGYVRGAGSAAFIAGSIFVGWMIPSSGLPIILWLQALLLMTVPIAVRGVPEGEVTPASRAPETTVTSESLRALWQNAIFCRIVLIAALVLGSHAMHDTFAVIRWTAAGISPGTASWLWSESVAAEVVVFVFIGPGLVRRLNPAGAIALASLAGALRWGVTAMTVDVTALIFTQPLHGLTFALLHLACMRLLANNVPAHLAATAQAIYGVVGVGAATATLTLISGWLYGRFGPPAFGVMSLLSLSALPLTLGLLRAQHSPSSSIS